MADAPAPATGTPVATPGEGQYSLDHIYLKDCSFESPLTPGVFMEQPEPPEAGINIQTQINAVDSRPESREVVLSVTVDARSGDRSIFVCEVQIAALVTLGQVGEADQGRLLGARVPEALFPYAREAVSDMVVRGGFMPVMLQPIDFDAVYAQHASQQGQPLDS